MKVNLFFSFNYRHILWETLFFPVEPLGDIRLRKSLNLCGDPKKKVNGISGLLLVL